MKGLTESTKGLRVCCGGIRAAVQEARNERLRRQRAIAELNSAIARVDDAITKLAAAQLVTEEKLQRLIERDERRYGGNGGR